MLWRFKTDEAVWTRPPNKQEDEADNEFAPPRSKSMKREDFLRLNPFAGIVGSGEVAAHRLDTSVAWLFRSLIPAVRARCYVTCLAVFSGAEEEERRRRRQGGGKWWSWWSWWAWWSW